MTLRSTGSLLAALALTALTLSAASAQNTETPPAPTTVIAPAPQAETAPQLESQTATDQTKKKNRFRIGPEVGVYLPTSSQTRSQFGSSWVSLGVGFGSIGKVPKTGQTSLDLQVLYQTRGDNHAFLAPIGIGYRTALSQSGSLTTYVGATGDIYLADLRSADYNVHSGLRTGFGGSVLVGINSGESGFLEARYLAVSKIKGFDLSGLNLTAGYRF